MDRQQERNVEGVKEDRREKLREQDHAQEELSHMKEERDQRVKELEGQLQKQKLETETKSEDYNRAINDYNYSPYRG